MSEMTATTAGWRDYLEMCKPRVVLLMLLCALAGMFLATPLVSMLKIILQNTEPGKPVAELMAGRWQTNNQAG